jgi:hypothetical protein
MKAVLRPVARMAIEEGDGISKRDGVSGHWI